MIFIEPFILLKSVKNYVFFLFLLSFNLGLAQNALEKHSFKTLSDYLDNHKNTDALYFDYLKAYENKAIKVGKLEHIFYAKSKYIIHHKDSKKRLLHGKELLKYAVEKQDLKYTGLAYNKLALIYYMERDLEQSLHYELLAENALSKTDDFYNLNKSRYGIGTIYYFVGDYDKALSFFTKTANYYKNQNSYNHLRGHISSLQYIVKNYIALNRFSDGVRQLNILAEETNRLKKDHLELENGYLSLLNGQNLYSQKQYNASLNHLQNALPVIKKNDDFANEHLVYLYLGKNLWELNQVEKAVEQFNKIDLLYTEKKYMDLNLLEAYDYLINYHKKTNNLGMQLIYTEKLLAANNQLQKQYKGLSNLLHNKYETKKLEASRKELQTKLNVQERKGYLLYGFAITLAIGFVGYITYNRKKQKTLRKNYEYFVQKQMLSELNAEPAVMNVTKEARVKNDEIVFEEKEGKEEASLNKEEKQADKSEQRVDKKVLAEDKVQEILRKLNQFEKKHRYINQEINLNTLAKYFNTNVKYLSEVINSTKNENFSNYINTLRIQYALLQLHKNKKLRKFTISAISSEFGFNNSRSFSDAFIKITGLKPSYYILQIEKDDKKSSLK